MREVELKFRVKNREKLMKKLDDLGCKIENVVMQSDSVYVDDLNSVESKEGSIWLRVRKENGRVELNCKKQSNKIQESQEIEFGVDSYEKANKFLEALGYHKWVVVNKKRLKTRYLDYNLCIDEVEKLGTFIEIELLVDESDKRDYIEDLRSVAEVLDLDKENVVNSHYDTMISELSVN